MTCGMLKAARLCACGGAADGRFKDNAMGLVGHAEPAEGWSGGWKRSWRRWSTWRHKG